MKSVTFPTSLRPALMGVLICVLFALHADAQPKMSIAIMTLKNASGITAGEAELISDRLGAELFNTGQVNVMERNQMQDILKEQGFQQSGTCTDEDCLVEVGQMLGVEGLVSGSIGKLGKLYLINLRVINVGTARITHVVSEDVDGGIEEVVGRLRPIARQLVGQAFAPKQPEPKPTPEPIPEPTPEPITKPTVPPPPPQREVVVESPSTDEATEQVPSSEPIASVALDERKQNRSGIRFSFAYMFGSQQIEQYNNYLGTWENYSDHIDEYLSERESYGEDVSTTNVTFRAQMTFMIKAGRFITIDLGPGVLRSTYRFSNDFDGYSSHFGEYLLRDQDSDLRVTSPFLNTGVNFTPRLYPWKFNVGLFLQANLNFVAYDYSFYFSNSTTTNTDSEDAFDVGFNIAFGPRLGAEILLSPKFGLGLDFVYTYSRLTSELDSDEYSEESETFRIKPPGVGLQLGLNIYY